MLGSTSERLDLRQLIQGYTRGGPYQPRLEDELGSITVGKNADLVIVDRDVFASERYEIKESGSGKRSRRE